PERSFTNLHVHLFGLDPGEIHGHFIALLGFGDVRRRNKALFGEGPELLFREGTPHQLFHLPLHPAQRGWEARTPWNQCAEHGNTSYCNVLAHTRGPAAPRDLLAASRTACTLTPLFYTCKCRDQSPRMYCRRRLWSARIWRV